jgi:biopolymer transport protein ExbD
MMKKRAGINITPLIDVVFLLLFYFMSTTSVLKSEINFSITLPSEEGTLGECPLEVFVEIAEGGGVYIEGVRFDNMKRLVAQLAALKASADQSLSGIVVYVLPEDKVTQAHIVRVMDACAAAKIRNVSFADLK